MSLNRNNLLFYYATDFKTVGDVNNTLAAAGIASKYQGMVIKPHSGGNLTDLKDIIYAIKAIKPSFKVFGYTDFGNSADMTTWQTLVDAWVAALPTGYLNGIYLDNFGYDFALATRINQNTAITYIHTASLSAFLAGSDLVDLVGKVGTEAEPLVGRSSTIRDFVALHDFYLVNGNTASPTLESKEKQYGRLELSKGCIKKDTTGVHNIGFAGVIGAGTALSINQQAWEAALLLVNNYNLDFCAVAPFDYGATAHKYFYKFTSNTFSD